MSVFLSGYRHVALRGLAVSTALLLGIAAAAAQSGEQQRPQQDQSKQGQQPAAAAEAAAKEGQRKADEFVEASKAINGPAGNPECVWLGRRVVSLMWRDDLDTAFRHLAAPAATSRRRSAVWSGSAARSTTRSPKR